MITKAMIAKLCDRLSALASVPKFAALDNPTKSAVMVAVALHLLDSGQIHTEPAEQA
jgi:hypothetical protein